MEETQQHERDVKAPLIPHSVSSSQESFSGQKKQSLSERRRAVELRVIRFLASLICLIVAVYHFWSTHDLMVFLILVGVSTGQMGILEAVGLSQRRPEHRQEKGTERGRGDEEK